MPFNSPLTTGQRNMVRADHVAFQYYLLTTPNTIIFQAQVNEVLTSTVYAAFDWYNALVGAYTDVKIGQTVIIHETQSDLQNYVLRSRVRKAPTATEFYIGETGQNIQTDYYLTILDDYDIHERLLRLTSAGAHVKDWEVAYHNLPPIIGDLQSVYADLSGDNPVTFSFAPTAEAMADGAIISSWLWDVADGTITVGTSSSQNITVQFPGAATNTHRWVRLTVTDDNGVSAYFVFEVFTVRPGIDSEVVLPVSGYALTGTIDEGWNADVTAWAAVNTILDRTRVTLVGESDYGGIRAFNFTSGSTQPFVGNTMLGETSGAIGTVSQVVLQSGSWAGGDAAGILYLYDIVGTFVAETLENDTFSVPDVLTIDGVANPEIFTNILFIGRLRSEQNTTMGDEDYGVIQETAFQIEGFASQLGNLTCPGLTIEHQASPNAWGKIKYPTPARAITYALALHTTFLNIATLTFHSSHADFVARDLSIEATSMLDSCNQQGGFINARLIFAPQGECIFQRQAIYLSNSDRNSLDTILNVNTGLAHETLDMRLELEYGEQVGQVEVGGVAVSTGSMKEKAYTGRAPTVALGPGYEVVQLFSQILKSDQTETATRSEMAQRTANHLAFHNPHEELTVTFRDSFHWLIPAIHQWWTFTIAATDNTRNRVYTTNERWWLREVQINHDNEFGTRNVVATFERETVNTGAGIHVAFVPVTIESNLPVVPTLPDYPDFPEDEGINYPEAGDYDDIPFEGGDLGVLEPIPTEDNPGTELPDPGCDVLPISMKTGSALATDLDSILDAIYSVEVFGDGVISSAGGSTSWDWDTEPLGWSPPGGWSLAHDGTLGNGPGNFDGYYKYTGGPSSQTTTMIMTFTVPTEYISIFQLNAFCNGTTGKESATIRVQAGTFDETLGMADYPGALRTFSIEQTVTTVTVTLSVTQTFSGVCCDFFEFQYGLGARGDAFYFDYPDNPTAYGGTQGLRLDGAAISPTPSYFAGHYYTFEITGTGNPFSFHFADGNYADNSDSSLIIQVCGPGF